MLKPAALRPKRLIAVYVEQDHVEILRAHRQWRSWQQDSVETLEIPKGEILHDFLQRLNLRPKDKKATCLLLFLPLTYYTVHREHYPAVLGEQVEEAINFDWQENVFLEHERTLHFASKAFPLNQHLCVSIFSLQRDISEKFNQVLGGSGFQSFRIIPTATVYQALATRADLQDSSNHLHILARMIDSDHVELHRFLGGQLLDSVLIGKNSESFRIFVESIKCVVDGLPDQEISIRLMCADGEKQHAETFKRSWEERIQIEILNLEKSLIAYWVDYLLEQDQVSTFEGPLFLKPWKVPRVTWVLLALLGIYTGFALYQMHSHSRLLEKTSQLKREIAQLEAQWKPIEQLQNRIAKFQEDQKTLSQFSAEGYPVFEILTLLSQITPEDTWLNYFSLRKGQIILRGESKSAVKYLSELSKVDGFSEVKFASPVTRSPSSDLERFNVQFQVDLEKLRKTLALLPVGKAEENLQQDSSSPAQPAFAPPTPEQDEEPPLLEDDEESEDETTEEDEAEDEEESEE